MATGLQNLPLNKILPNPRNPRKTFDDTTLRELAASIREHGVRQPILVRPAGENWEIVIGERRYRAAKLAGHEDIPAIVDPKLSDREALEIMVIENLQREDITPLEEAYGYQALLRPTEKDEDWAEVTAETLAEKIGKSVGYIYARIKLLQLITAAREAFEAKHITAGHAVLIARLQPREQLAALGACFNTLPPELDKGDDPRSVALATLFTIDDPEAMTLLPEKGLREWIQENVNLELKAVPWDLEDADLVEEAGPCSTCPKRSSSNPNLFQELAVKGKDTCFDPGCYHEKQKAYVQRARALARQQAKDGGKPIVELSEQASYTRPKEDQKIYKKGQWVEAKVGSCPNVVAGLIVRGEQAGLQLNVCCDPDCRTHKKEGLMGSSSGSAGRTDYDLENFKRHKQEIAGEKKSAAQAVLLKAIVEKIGARLPVEIIREVARQLFKDNWRNDEKQVVGYLLDLQKPKQGELEKVIAKGEGQVLNRLLVVLLGQEYLRPYKNAEARAELAALAKSLGVKGPDKILAAADADIGKMKQCRACKCTETAPCRYFDKEWQACSWVEEDGAESDLCSNPVCAKYDPKKKAKAAEK